MNSRDPRIDEGRAILGAHAVVHHPGTMKLSIDRCRAGDGEHGNRGNGKLPHANLLRETCAKDDRAAAHDQLTSWTGNPPLPRCNLASVHQDEPITSFRAASAATMRFPARR